MGSDGDLGYFGPSSVSWQVHREVTVLFGGARAVLMQAAHPLVIAGARETGFYERNPWKRLQRTLPGQVGCQLFFTEGRRPFCLYVVVAGRLHLNKLIAQVNKMLAGLEL